MAAAAAYTLRRPAEWLRHACTILAWPSKGGYLAKYPDSLNKATSDVSSIAKAVALFQPVTLLVDHERLEDAKKQFSSVSTPHPITIQKVLGNGLELWMRDIAPTFVVKHGPGSKQTLCGVDFNFNGWGNRYPAATTRSLARTILQDTQTERIHSSITTEGGALEVDGRGTLLATESSLLNSNRNPSNTRRDVELELKRTLGVEKTIWIPGRKGIDTTDNHIDALARFVDDTGTILLSRPSTLEKCDWTDVYSEARDVLASATCVNGRGFNIIEIKEADPLAIGLDEPSLQAIVGDGKDAPILSYVNYLLVNDGVILPQFGDTKKDAKAVDIIQGVFGSARKVVPVMIEELPLQGGGIHCASQEVPLVEG